MYVYMYIYIYIYIHIHIHTYIHTYKGKGRLNPQDPKLDRCRTLAKELAQILVESLTDDNMQIKLEKILPDKWGPDKKERMVGTMAYRSSSWKRGIQWFTKGNEALGKEKLRGIANPDEVRSTLGVISAGLLERVIFDPSNEIGEFFCDRSIKHAAPKELRARVADLAARMGSTAHACGADFGPWDSRLLGPVKNAVENVISAAFVDAVEMPLDVTEEVKKARMQENLRARGRFNDIAAEDCGRLSGDRGTSVFNYITNFVLLIVAIEQITGRNCSMSHYILSICSGSAGFEFMFEGDGWSLILSSGFYHGKAGWGRRPRGLLKRHQLPVGACGARGNGCSSRTRIQADHGGLGVYLPGLPAHVPRRRRCHRSGLSAAEKVALRLRCIF